MRVLVDRLWPRGLRKETVALDHWIKEVAPSTELRKWYGHDPAKFAEFRSRYREELTTAPAQAAVKELRELNRGEPLILLTGTKNLEQSHAVVLREVLEKAH